MQVAWVRCKNIWIAFLEGHYTHGECYTSAVESTWKVVSWLWESGPEVIKLFPCSTQLSMKFFLLLNVKMPTIVGILTFMSRKNSILSLSEPEKCWLYWYFHTYEHLKFHAQVSWAWKKFYNLGARLYNSPWWECVNLSYTGLCIWHWFKKHRLTEWQLITEMTELVEYV